MSFLQVEKYPYDILSETGDIKQLKEKTLHIVCPAISEYSIAIKYLAGHLRMNLKEVIRLINIVNNKKEPGCLYPLYTITLIPEHQLGEDLNFYMEETMKAQEQYFKTETMLFAFDNDSWPDMEMVKNVLQQKIDEWNNAGKIKYLKSCYFIS